MELNEASNFNVVFTRMLILKEINISGVQLIIARWNARYFLKIVGGFFLDSARFGCLIEKREKESEIYFTSEIEKSLYFIL